MSSKGFKQQRWPSRSFKFGDSTIRQATYDYSLVFHCNYVSILHHFRHILSLICHNLKMSRDPEHIPFRDILLHMQQHFSVSISTQNLQCHAVSIPKIWPELQKYRSEAYTTLRPIRMYAEILLVLDKLLNYHFCVAFPFFADCLRRVCATVNPSVCPSDCL